MLHTATLNVDTDSVSNLIGTSQTKNTLSFNRKLVKVSTF